jgi:hypothetical protein
MTPVQRCVDGLAWCERPPGVASPFVCPACRRAWRLVDRGHGPFWSWNGQERRPR